MTKDIFSNLFCIFIIIAIIFVCLFTPEKTKSGEYTNIVKYWFDSEYVDNNF